MSKEIPLVEIPGARSYFIDGFAELQSLGVNTLFMPYRLRRDEKGHQIRRVDFTIVMATGKLSNEMRNLRDYAFAHNLPCPCHKDT